jgi:hypothetical protein
MRANWKNIAVAVGVVLVAGVIALIVIYPYRPNSALSWLALFCFALPVWFVLEYGGHRTLSLKWVSRFSPVGRILYGVLVMGLFMAVILIASKFLEPFFGKWGS